MLLQQDKIHVFPFGNTRPTDPLARVLNEQNIALLARRLSVKPSYVLDYYVSDNNEHIVEFMLEGYYFKADVTSVLNEYKGSDIYAVVDFDIINGYKYLKGGDKYSPLTPLDNAYQLPDYGTVNFKTVNASVKFEYTFKNPSDKIILFRNSSFRYSVSGATYSESETSSEVYIISDTGRKCSITIEKTNSAANFEAVIGMVVNHPDDFDGIQFKNKTELQPEDKYHIHLFDTSGNVAVESKIDGLFDSKVFTATEELGNNGVYVIKIDQTLPKLSSGEYWLLPITTYFSDSYVAGSGIQLKYMPSGETDYITKKATLKMMNNVDAVSDCFMENTVNQIYVRTNPDESVATIFINSGIATWWQ